MLYARRNVSETESIFSNWSHSSGVKLWLRFKRIQRLFLKHFRLIVFVALYRSALTPSLQPANVKLIGNGFDIWGTGSHSTAERTAHIQVYPIAQSYTDSAWGKNCLPGSVYCSRGRRNVVFTDEGIPVVYGYPSLWWFVYDSHGYVQLKCHRQDKLCVARSNLRKMWSPSESCSTFVIIASFKPSNFVIQSG